GLTIVASVSFLKPAGADEEPTQSPMASISAPKRVVVTGRLRVEADRSPGHVESRCDEAAADDRAPAGPVVPPLSRRDSTEPARATGARTCSPDPASRSRWP